MSYPFMYDPDTGYFFWIKPAPLRTVGHRADRLKPIGYRYVSYQKKDRLAHRIAWEMMTGEKPPRWVEHINGVRHDNRWCNLRGRTENGEIVYPKVKEPTP